MTTPFKLKDVNKEITPKDIGSLMEHANYTNKYLQVLGESISKEKVFTKPKDHGSSSSAKIPFKLLLNKESIHWSPSIWYGLNSPP